ncbi:MAG TPA: radical SAM protein [Spirochaetota bacterium]|nr:radical SAM protein [Spirochaetota bacterium]
MNDNISDSIVFGPVPSRRLGRSLGINNIPPVYCSYSCIYCQLGRNKKISTERKNFYAPEDVLRQAEIKINEVLKNNDTIDYISFVPDGEPTLDISLGKTIRLLKKTGIKIAVITNSSLLSDEKVRDDLLEADWISLKADTTTETIWRRINRPHIALNLAGIQRGMVLFSLCFAGELNTETMLVQGINTGEKEFLTTANFIKALNPQRAYISIPTRPPAEQSVIQPDEATVIDAYRIFSGKGLNVECITGHEGNEFSHTGNIVEDILSITSVHPMREDSLKTFISEAGKDWSTIEQLISEKRLIESEFNGKRFYFRKFKQVNDK